MKNPIFHYCTVESVKEILKNKTLRLADIRKSNDSKEIDFLFDSYCEYVLNTNNFSNEAVLKVNRLKTDKKIQFQNTVFLVSCFSKKEDNLHMWSCYGNKGVCLEFDRGALEKYIGKIRAGCSPKIINENPNITFGIPVLKLVDVDYRNQTTISSYFEEKEFKGNDAFLELFRESPRFKSDFFASEEEVRIIYCHIFDSITNDANFLVLVNDSEAMGKQIYFKSISDRNFQHKIVIDIPITMNLIKSITIGPNSTITEQDIEEILFINGVEKHTIGIGKSSGTYR